MATESPPPLSVPPPSLVIVDDEKSYADLLAQLLDDLLSCPIHIFTDPLAALDAIPQLNVGLVVTDFSMPDLNGAQLIERVTANHPDIPFILITGDVVALDDAQNWQLPALKQIVPKPFRRQTLAAAISTHWAGGPRRTERPTSNIEHPTPNH